MAVRLEVEVLDSTGTPLFQIQHDDIQYVVARPGPYTVRVRHLGPQKMYITMSIDGTTCGECMTTSTAQWFTFKGFRAGTSFVKGQQQVRYKEFVFVDVGDNPVGAGGGAAAVDSLGTIEVTVEHQKATRCVGLPACDRCALWEKQAGKAAPKVAVVGADNKKFFLLPSLGSKAGAASTSEHAAPTYHFAPVGGVVSRVKLRCETAGTLRLRQVLDPRNPEHRALLPAAAAAVPAGAAAARAAQPGVGVKREEAVDLTQEDNGVAARRKRVKRETLDLTVDSDGAAASADGARVVLDLTADD